MAKMDKPVTAEAIPIFLDHTATEMVMAVPVVMEVVVDVLQEEEVFLLLVKAVLIKLLEALPLSKAVMEGLLQIVPAIHMADLVVREQALHQMDMVEVVGATLEVVEVPLGKIIQVVLVVKEEQVEGVSEGQGGVSYIHCEREGRGS